MTVLFIFGLLLHYLPLIGCSLQPTTLHYSEPRCRKSFNPHDPLHLTLPCVRPGANFWVSATFDSSVDLNNVIFNQSVTLCSPNCISGLTDVSVGSIPAKLSTEVNLTLSAPVLPGLYKPLVMITSDNTFIDSFYLQIEVTCSNGNFCDGIEMWIDGACVQGANPCDDGHNCTVDKCIEARMICNYTPGPDCRICGNCDQTCEELGTRCGTSDCAEDCGQCTLANDICLPDIGCTNASLVRGTCGNPIVLFSDGEIPQGTTIIKGTTADGADLISPSCAPQSKAPEKIYTFNISTSIYIDFRVYGFDTVLALFTKGLCSSKAFHFCSDDSTPPGHLGSRIQLKLNPGTYYLMVDGFAGNEFGNYTLEIRVNQYCEPICSGKFCGNNSCGGDCGPCGDGLECSPKGSCIPNPCISSCNVTRFCGIGECGEDCGHCDNDEVCMQSTGQCIYSPECNHLVPVCTPVCGTGEYCGSDCTCYALDQPQPDLIISEEYLRKSIHFSTETFSDKHCAIVEQCLSRPGVHRLLRFGVEAINQGKGSIVGMDPRANPRLYQWSPCHGHYHFLQFSEYYLLSSDGKIVREGRKQAYCLRDSRRILTSPSVPCKPIHDCVSQGISSGWSDLYGPTLDCQWLELNNIEPGNYILFVSLNPARIIHESNFENNGVFVPITLTAKELGLTTTVPIPVPVVPSTP